MKFALGDRPPPQIPHSPLPPRGGRHGRGPAPLPEPEDQVRFQIRHTSNIPISRSFFRFRIISLF